MSYAYKPDAFQNISPIHDTVDGSGLLKPFEFLLPCRNTNLRSSSTFNLYFHLRWCWLREFLYAQVSCRKKMNNLQAWFVSSGKSDLVLNLRFAENQFFK